MKGVYGEWGGVGRGEKGTDDKRWKVRREIDGVTIRQEFNIEHWRLGILLCDIFHTSAYLKKALI